MAVPVVANVGYQYCTGAVDIYYAFNTGLGYANSSPSPGSALYLGTCEQYPLVQGLKHWVPTFNDIGGPVPFDKQFFGEFKVLVLDLNKFKEVNLGPLIASFSQETRGARGLYKNETALYSKSFTLWLKFDNFGSPASIADLPPGECYFNCAIPEDGYDPIGTRNRKTKIIVEADPAYQVGGNLGSSRGFNTYSSAAALFAALPLAA